MPQDQAIRISMDGRGAWRDNVFVERLWRSVKYAEVYLRTHDSVCDARASLGRYLVFYNGRHPHSSLGARTPQRAYLDHLPQTNAGMTPPLALRLLSDWATPFLHQATAPAGRAYQPAGKLLIGTETL